MSRENEEQEESLRDTITAAFRGEEGAAEPVEKESAPDAAPADEGVDGAPKEVTDKAATGTVDDKAEAKDAKAYDPPARWTKAQKEWFLTLEPGVQKQLLEQDKHIQADYSRKTGEIAQERQRYQGIEQVLAPHRQTWQRAGMNDADALKSIMSYWDLANRDPVQFIDTVARERGIDLRSHFAPSQQEIEQLIARYMGEAHEGGEAGPQQMHPSVQAELNAIRNENAQLREYVQNLGGTVSHQQQAQLQAQQVQAQQTLAQFAAETDEAGQPLRPFLDEVRQDMAHELRMGAKDLTEAYDRAVWKRTDTRQKLLETQELQRRREDERRRQEEAARAKRAGASVSAAPSPAAPPDDDDEDVSIRALLKRGFDQSRMAGRV